MYFSDFNIEDIKFTLLDKIYNNLIYEIINIFFKML